MSFVGDLALEVPVDEDRHLAGGRGDGLSAVRAVSRAATSLSQACIWAWHMSNDSRCWRRANTCSGRRPELDLAPGLDVAVELALNDHVGGGETPAQAAAFVNVARAHGAEGALKLVEGRAIG